MLPTVFVTKNIRAPGHYMNVKLSRQSKLGHCEMERSSYDSTWSATDSRQLSCCGAETVERAPQRLRVFTE